MNIVNTSNAVRRQFLLVVDSNPGSRKHTSTLLERFAYKVWTADNAEEALDITSAALPALILTAQHLIDMPAVDFIRKLKRQDHPNRHPVIVLTPHADAANERTCLAAGAVTCLKMPVGVENLYRVVQVAVEPVPRMNIRINTKLPVAISSHTVKCGDGKCVRVLSENGLFVQTADHFPVNTRLPIKLNLGGKLLAAEAVVLYTLKPGNQADHEPGMGLQFTRIDQKDQERIRLYIREEVMRGIAASRS